MDLITTLVGAALLALCILPLIWANQKRKRRQKQVISALLGNAALQAGAVTQYDCWHNTAIGIDEEKDNLYFIKFVDGEQHFQSVNLSNVTSCRATGTGDGIHAEKLELILEQHATPATVLQFYHSQHAMQINDELVLLNKWESIINSKLPVSRAV